MALGLLDGQVQNRVRVRDTNKTEGPNLFYTILFEEIEKWTYKRIIPLEPPDLPIHIPCCLQVMSMAEF